MGGFESFLMLIIGVFVTSGFWYANEEPDYDDPNYRGNDTIPIDDFL